MKSAHYDTNHNAEAASSDDKNATFFDRTVKFYTSKFHIFLIILDFVVGSVEIGEGARHNNECPIQPMIIIFLIVHGALTIFSGALMTLAVLLAKNIYYHSGKRIARTIFVMVVVIITLLNMFFFAWFIAGNVWVFGARTNGVQGSDSTNTSTYCQQDVYRAAFVLIIARYIVFPIIIIIVVIVRLCKKKK